MSKMCHMIFDCRFNYANCWVEKSPLLSWKRISSKGNLLSRRTHRENCPHLVFLQIPCEEKKLGHYCWRVETIDVTVNRREEFVLPWLLLYLDFRFFFSSLTCSSCLDCCCHSVCSWLILLNVWCCGLGFLFSFSSSPLFSHPQIICVTFSPKILDTLWIIIGSFLAFFLFSSLIKFCRKICCVSHPLRQEQFTVYNMLFPIGQLVMVLSV